MNIIIIIIIKSIVATKTTLLIKIMSSRHHHYKLNGFLLTRKLKHKCLVKVRPFSSAKVR